MWAHGNYLSRRFHPGMATGAPEGCEVPCLIPGLDMFNHRTGEKVTLEADAEHAQIVCDAPVAAGTEIFINYGHKSNEELLFAYGFCLRDNPLDLVTIQLACDGAGEGGGGAAARPEGRGGSVWGLSSFGPKRWEGSLASF